MKVKIVPYCEVDGIKTFSDSEIKGLWERLKSQGNSKYFQGHECYEDVDHFLYAMKSGRMSLYIVLAEQTVVGCFWLNNFQERFCQLHYIFFKEWWGKTKEIGVEVFKQVLSWEEEGGEYLFDMLTGIVDKEHALAIRLAGKCKWQIVGELPKGKWNKQTGKSRPALMLCLTREMLEGE